MAASLKHITIGVAGHVDHGKTSLVKSLSGIDTDRLKEEKLRRLSIESGVALLHSDDNMSIALVDVPGHTDYLKNTVAGLSCVDFAILVVAADDGVMPQTLEHVNILTLNGVKDGFIVLNKTDLVDNQTLELAELEIRDSLIGTFLDGKPVLPFFSQDNRGLTEIRRVIHETSKNISSKIASGPFRLWIDRIRALSGFGSVVSGTVLSGRIKTDDPLVLMPSGINTRARSLECHHEKITEASAGQRIGINLHRTPLKDVKRGMVVAEPGSMEPSYIFNVYLRILDATKTPVNNRQKIKVHIGTAALIATLVLMEKEHLGPGEEDFGQLRFMKPLAALPKDRFIISLMNIPTIAGGGQILENTREKLRGITTQETLAALKALKSENIGQYMDLQFHKKGLLTINLNDIAQNTGFVLPDIRSEVDNRKDEFIVFKNFSVMSRSIYERLINTLPGVIDETLKKDIMKKNVKQEEIKAQLAPKLDYEPLNKMLAELCSKGILAKEGGGFRPSRYSAALSEEQNRIVNIILDHASQTGIIPFSADTIWKRNNKKFEKDKIKRLMSFLQNQKRLVCVNDGRFLSVEALEQIKEKITEVIRSKGFFAISDCTPTLGYGRTVAIPILEYLDKVGFTLRLEEGRVLKENDKPLEAG